MLMHVLSQFFYYIFAFTQIKKNCFKHDEKATEMELSNELQCIFSVNFQTLTET